MPLQLEMHLIDMGILPATMLGELEEMAQPKVYPDLLVNKYYKDPRDENGNVPF